MRRLLILVGLLMTSQAFADDGWTLQRDRDGIKIWTRLEEGRRIESYKAEMIVPVAADLIEKKIAVAEAFGTWAPDIREARSIQDTHLSYIVYAMPFPVKDRDLVQEITINRREEMTEIIMTARADALPEKARRVRVLEADLTWHLVPLSDDRTKITSIGYTDPRGVPPFILNMLIVDAPYRTMTALRASFD